jgi:hypothetical protein
VLLGRDPGALDDDELRDHVRALVRLQARVDAAVLAATGEFDQRAAYLADGMVNTRAWLAHHCGVARTVAGSILWLARRVRYMPVFAAALSQGTITFQHARVMARALSPRTLDAFGRDEAALAGHAAALEVDDFARVVARWVLVADPDGPDPGADPPSELHVSAMLDGRHRVDGEFDLVDSAEYLAELDARYQEIWHQDHSPNAAEPDRARTRSQRYAAAQVEMARRSSAAGEEGRSPSKPQLIVRVDVQALRGDPTGLAELEDGSAVPQDVLQQWACDSAVGRVVMRGRSIPFDLGQLTYTASPGQRRILAARDRGCIVPGCKHHPRWCQAHHINPWPNGPTNIDNLVLLCARHHKHVHRKLINILPGPAPGTFTVTRSDGTPLLERAPPNPIAA